MSIFEPVLRLFAQLSKVTGQPVAPTDFLRVLIIVPVYLAASYFDVQERRVPDKLWKPLIVIGTALMIVDLTLFGQYRVLLPRMLANIVIGTILGAGLYYLPRLPLVPDRVFVFGGADMKAIVVASLFMPTYPFSGFTFFRPDPYPGRYFIIAIFTWAAFVGGLYLVVHALTMLTRNYASGDGIAFPEALFAYRVPIDEFATLEHKRSLTENGQITMQGVRSDTIADYLDWRNSDNSGVTAVDSLTEVSNVYLEQYLNWNDEMATPSEAEGYTEEHLEEDEARLQRLFNREYVWTAPDLPYVAIITAGLLLAILIGDPAYVLALLLT